LAGVCHELNGAEIKDYRQKITPFPLTKTNLRTASAGQFRFRGFREIAGAVVQFQLLFPQFRFDYLDLDTAIRTIARFI
jgi:hypothetical protein